MRSHVIRSFGLLVLACALTNAASVIVPEEQGWSSAVLGQRVNSETLSINETVVDLSHDVPDHELSRPRGYRLHSDRFTASHRSRSFISKEAKSLQSGVIFPKRALASAPPAPLEELAAFRRMWQTGATSA